MCLLHLPLKMFRDIKHWSTLVTRSIWLLCFCSWSLEVKQRHEGGSENHRVSSTSCHCSHYSPTCGRQSSSKETSEWLWWSILAAPTSSPSCSNAGGQLCIATTTASTSMHSMTLSQRCEFEMYCVWTDPWWYEFFQLWLVHGSPYKSIIEAATNDWMNMAENTGLGDSVLTRQPKCTQGKVWKESSVYNCIHGKLVLNPGNCRTVFRQDMQLERDPLLVLLTYKLIFFR